MRKQREPQGLLSRLPEDHAYWEALTDRLVTHAAGRLHAHRGVRTRWWHGLARYSTPLVVGAAAAALAGLLWLPEVAPERAAGRPTATLYGLAPNDPLATLFVTSVDVPTMATVLATPTVERTR